jgi:L-aspartate oxidase
LAEDAGRLPDQLGRRYLTEFDTAELTARSSDVLVIGSGIAGLTVALGASRSRSVNLVTKSVVSDTATWYAQGGIAGAVGAGDSVGLHLADTLAVGQGLCDEDVVRTVVGEAEEALDELRGWGVTFDTAAGGAVDLHREAGHSLPRVLHTGDATGAEVQNTMSSAVRAAERVGVYEERFLVDLLTGGDRCVGALVYDPAAHELEVFWAGAVVLATGGCGQLYRTTTNPAIATGDGVAAAWRAGADIADLEFVQFHPTALDIEESPRFLITEALRGEGARLLDCDEQPFMDGVHPLGDLAPRDVVTREIERVMRRCDRPFVWLDARHLDADRVRERFPTIYERCAEAGFDLSKDLVPVAPAAHYMIGGAWIDIDGRTSLEGLYASGEVTASGLHGANRLASNSLLEGLVFSRRIVRDLDRTGVVMHADARVVSGPYESSAVFRMDVARGAIQGVMTEFAGTSRSAGSLMEAASILEGLAGVLDVTLARPDEMELQNMVTVATLLTHAAWYREESRGTHHRSDHPARDDERWRVRTRWARGRKPREERVGGVEPSGRESHGEEHDAADPPRGAGYA